MEQAQTAKPKGRPKGSKNRLRLHISEDKIPSPSHSKISHRGRPNIVAWGKKVTFNPEKTPHDWQRKLSVGLTQ